MQGILKRNSSAKLEGQIMEDNIHSTLLPDSHHLHFKKRREASHLSIQDISNRLRINEKYLYALENNTMPEHLPMIFVRGYVQSYARYLNVPEQQISTALQAFDRYQQEHKPVSFTPTPLSRSQPLRHSWIVSFATCVLILSLITLSATAVYYKNSAVIRLSELNKNIDFIKNYIKAHWQI